MKTVPFIKKNVCYILLALATLSVVASLFVTTSTYDTDGVAGHVSSRVQRRMERLDRFADQLLDGEVTAEEWPQMKGLPDDMVLYRYVDDTLQCWYNLFSVSNDDISDKALFKRLANQRVSLSSPLAKVTGTPSYLNCGPKWYVVKMKEKGGVKVLEGLLVKNSLEEDKSKGYTGINRQIHIHGRYDIVPLVSDEGSAVVIEGEPIFKVTVFADEQFSGPHTTTYGLRWLAIILLTLAIVTYLSSHRTPARCATVIGLITGIAFLARQWGVGLTDYSKFFSPALYAHDGFLNSFGTLIIFNTAISLTIFCIFICRNEIGAAVQGKRSKRIVLGTLLSIIAVLIAVYVYITFSSLIRDSGMMTELFRFNELSGSALIAYLSYALLCVSFLLEAETARIVFSRDGGCGKMDFLSLPAILLFSIFAAAALATLSTRLGFSKEQSKVMGWSNRLAVDRDLAAELELMAADKLIESDPVLDMLVHMDGSDALLQHRLDEMYFRRLANNYDMTVASIKSYDSPLRATVEEIMASGTVIDPSSHFFYTFDPVTGSRYTGIFNFYSTAKGLSALLIDITPKLYSGYGIEAQTPNAGSVALPQNYSYAKYNDDRLVSFSGNYAYPTLIGGIINEEQSNRVTFIRDRYRHFVNRISHSEIIVISRRERSLISYFVSVTCRILLIFLTAFPFRRRQERKMLGPRYFSTRMRRLIELSLCVTLLVMASISVLFVYQRNERNMENILSGRISSIQLMLDRVAHSMASSAEMWNPSFVDNLKEIGRSTRSVITIYTAEGRLLLSSSPETFDKMFSSSRINSDAYRKIALEHLRYYINREDIGRRSIYMLYAPVLGVNGEMIAIASTPYIAMNYDFRNDAIYHSAAILCIFFILLFITILFASSMTEAIFRPLVSISGKMRSSADASDLQQIDYEGDDEISALVEAYNGMIVDLQESTESLAAAERDKAWSEMARQVAHEIKNPLTPIKLEVQRLLRLKKQNDPKWEEKFDQVSAVVLEHIDILSQTANEFSTFAKLYTEEPVEFDLDKALRDQILLFAQQNANVIYLGTDNAVILGPKPQIIRVFVNLLANAVQAVSQVDDPQVMVSLRRGVSSGTWDIVFEDNGPGVDEENLPRLFSPNFTTKSSGTGLGLAICRSIVDRCGGTISYSRSFTLSGACFTVTLPESVSDKETNKE